MEGHIYIGLAIIILTLVGVAAGEYPWLRMNRATITLVGATLLVATKTITLEQAYHLIDMNTIALLLGVMILNVNLKFSGFFALVSSWVIKITKTPKQLLALVITSSGLLSSIFLNDTIVLTFTPILLNLIVSLKRNPIPYLIGLGVAANIGSAATIIGNPQNVIIGVSSGISFLRFSAYLIVPTLIGLAIAWGLIVLFYPSEFSYSKLTVPTQEIKVRLFKPLLYKSLIAVIVLLIALVIGISPPLAALGSASILLITRRLKPERVFGEIDWSLLVFFASLFVITETIEITGLGREVFDYIQPYASKGIWLLASATIILSNIVSNVPAVMLLRQLIPHLPNPEQAWITVALSSTFAGNLTLLGSVANLIVAEIARRHNVELSFIEFLKIGLPLTLLSSIIGIVWLSLIFTH